MGNVLAKDDERVLDDLAVDPERALAEMYRRYKQIFMGFTRDIGGDADLRIETYHDSILAFYDIWCGGRYDPSRASVSTLLCAIGKNKLLTKLGKLQREPTLGELDGVIGHAEEEDPVYLREELLSQVERALGELEEGCREIISMFYYQRMSIANIATRLQYKNENVVKAHKSRCMKRLREIIQSTDS